jgi:pseudolysin
LHAGLYWNEDTNKAADNDAFYNANITNNMYIAWFNSPAVLNLGTPDENGDSDLLPTQVYTHLKMSNAAWIEPLKSIFLGDGSEEDDTTPFTSLDVVAHELSHGFTNQHANLVYKNQSGGLNESFSDMAAVAASYYLTSESNWTIGSEISSSPLRYIDNPRHDCVGKTPYIDIGGYKIRRCSIDHMKDYKDGEIDGIPFVDVHLSSGIFNKVFYLMAQGFGGDKQQGTQKAFNVMVQANRGYWTPNTSFQDAACGVMEATRDYGYDENVVTKAMSTVGIDVNKC